MKVKDFINKLQKLPEDYEILLATEYKNGSIITGFDIKPKAKVISIKTKKRSYLGDIDLLNNDCNKGGNRRKAVIIF